MGRILRKFGSIASLHIFLDVTKWKKMGGCLEGIEVLVQTIKYSLLCNFSFWIGLEYIYIYIYIYIYNLFEV